MKDLFTILKLNLQESKSYEKFSSKVFEQLKAINELNNRQKYEKELQKETKDLKSKYNTVIEEFKTEQEEK